VTVEATSDIYYDPYDVELDIDPYPTFRRMRDEAPLYYNERYDFFALTRFDDIQRCELDWKTYSSARGSVLEVIKTGIELPPGNVLFEDPPSHDVHRGLLSRVFTPKRMLAIEPEVRAFCARALDPLVGSGGFDFIADLGAEVPMRTIGMLLGIPESDQEAIRDRIDEGMRHSLDGSTTASAVVFDPSLYADYVAWRAENPSDDLMTDLLNAEIPDESGVLRPLTREEVLNYVALVSAAGVETTTRLIGWAGKVLAEHPDQRSELVEDPGLIPNAIEELLRFESPSPTQARSVVTDVEHYGTTVPAGSAILLVTAAGNRDDRVFPDPDRFDIHRKIDHHLAFGYGIHFCLGSHLARLEARVALEEVLKRFPSWDVDWDHAVQAHTTTVRGWEQLPVFTG